MNQQSTEKLEMWVLFCMHVHMEGDFSSVSFGFLWTHLDKEFHFEIKQTCLCPKHNCLWMVTANMGQCHYQKLPKRGWSRTRSDRAAFLVATLPNHCKYRGEKNSTHMPNLCFHIMLAYTRPSWLLIEKLLQPIVNYIQNRGGGVMCQYMLKVGTRALKLPGIWKTLFIGSCSQEGHNSDVFIVLD